MRKRILTGLLLLAGTVMQAQVGIGTTTPEASAALDITATDKGLLVPRLTEVQRLAIATPATGLLVIQTDGMQGFYYNSGTPTAPGWINLSAYTLQQNINTNGKYISGDGSNTGLQITGNGVVVGKGTYNPFGSTIEESGSGAKMIWFPGKAAFRAGVVSGNQWNSENIGMASIALGSNVTASGLFSSAMGSNVSTNGKTGSFIMGDVSSVFMMNDADYQMKMRFENGYRFYSNNNATTPVLDIARNGDIAYGGTLNMGIQYVIRDYSLHANSRASYNCGCPEGYQLMGGGGGHPDYNSASSDIKVNYSGPYVGNEKAGWKMIVTNTSGSSRGIRVYAICAKVK